MLRRGVHLPQDRPDLFGNAGSDRFMGRRAQVDPIYAVGHRQLAYIEELRSGSFCDRLVIRW